MRNPEGAQLQLSAARLGTTPKRRDVLSHCQTRMTVTPDRSQTVPISGAQGSRPQTCRSTRPLRRTSERVLPLPVSIGLVGGERFIDSLRCLAPHGHLVVLGLTSGRVPTVRPLQSTPARQRLGGRPQGGAMSESLVSLARQARIRAYVERGELRPVIGKIVPL